MFDRLLFTAPLLVGTAVFAATDFSVGSFGKSSAAAPTTQVVSHGLGQPPRAMLFWTAGQTVDGVAGNVALFSESLCDATGCRVVSGSTGLSDGGTTTSRHLAAHAFSFVDSTRAVLGEADIASWDDSTVTLQWSSNWPAAVQCHFIAFGGSSLQTKLVQWARPTTTPTGTAVISGVGFVPDAVIFTSSGHGTVGVPSSATDLLVQASAAARDGGQWNLGIRTGADATASRWLERGPVLTGGDFGIPPYNIASLRSMDPDGFTVDFTKSAGVAGAVFSLALRGVQAAAGTFDKTVAPAPALQSVTGLGFQPKLVVLVSAMDLTRAAIANHGAFGLGATTGAAQQASAGMGRPALGGGPVFATAFDSSGTAFTTLDLPSGAIAATASLASLDSDGFSLLWTANDAQPTSIAWLAFSSAEVDGGTDAGVDGGMDAGTDFGADGGTAPQFDAGAIVGPPALRVGCGCDSDGSGGLALVATFAVFLRSRRCAPGGKRAAAR